jgi:hypothetical protein
VLCLVRDFKFEARNPKFETSTNFQMQMTQTETNGLEIGELEFFVSDFDIRI